MKALYRGISYDLSSAAAPVLSPDAQPTFRGQKFDLVELESPSPQTDANAMFRGHQIGSGKQRTVKRRKTSDRLSRTLSALSNNRLAH